MRKFRYSLLIAVGFLIFASTQFTASTQDRQMGAKSVRAWGSGPATAATGIEGVDPVLGSCGFTTLRFDELPFQPVNGLQFRGAQFTFTINGQPSTDAFYNAAGPGIQTFVQDPSLEGNALGVLELDFPALTPSLIFGVARDTSTPLVPGMFVVFVDPAGNSIGPFSLNLRRHSLADFQRTSSTLSAARF